MKQALPTLGVIIFLTLGAQAQYQPVLTGDTYLHDPSIIEVDGHYLAFSTGGRSNTDQGMPRTKTSPDLLDWTDTGPISNDLPNWIEPELGYRPGNIWAPAVSNYNGTFYLYYSASSFGINDSAIGLMTSTALDPARPEARWQDQGMVVRSFDGGNFNAIDPHRIDTPDGRSWLSFGSFWDGIRLIELDPATGLRLNNTQPLPIASRGGGAIEAPTILFHDDYYYLFVSFDRCCRGTWSTYKIKFGRAKQVTGPYLDAKGKPMLDGGGTQILSSTGSVRGPGGQEIFASTNGPMLAYHYYDRNQQGLSKLQIAPLNWDEDGWPYLNPLP